jgi:hydrogenase expression/formation protein HypC
MCLAIPAKLVSADGPEGVADLHGNRVAVSLLLLPEAGVGDWILIHAGFAIQKIDEEDAQETWAVLRDLQAATDEASEGTHEG